MSQPREHPGDSGSGEQATLTLSFSEMIRSVKTLAVKTGTRNTPYWVHHADRQIQEAEVYLISNDIGRAFVNYAKAAVILRVILPSLPGYLQLTTDEQSSIASKLQESCRYIRLFEKNLLDGNTRYHNASENHQKEQKWWEQLRELTKYNDGAEDEEASSSAIQMQSDAVARDTIDHENLPIASRFSLPAALTPESVSIPEAPPSPLSHWIVLHPLDSYQPDIPKAAPEPTSLYMDLHSFEDRADSIPEAPPEPRSMWIELHPVGGKEHTIPEVAPEPTSLYLDLRPLENGEDSIPDDLPEPQSYWIDLHPIDQSTRPVPEVPPESMSMLLDLHPSEDAS
ncbi:hypothetical protein FIBSPDRAFT_1040283 [Athelia psychrophila]|uniref:USP8 dimerisation domain-containing protein n=1 Tax=Athelia psychrophila TaxID=1759441 RepID=A0A166QEX3_9AGAM|nr:hypothetical protein FIBSPDRAFT_1040283 [Fibularhizoctonia sp. CBS 109695]